MSLRRGEVPFQAGGQSYILRLAVNEMAKIEEHFGLPFAKAVEKIQGNDALVGDILFFFATAMKMPVEEAGEIMSDLGMGEAAELIGKSLAAAFPEDDESPKSGNARSRKRT